MCVHNFRIKLKCWDVCYNKNKGGQDMDTCVPHCIQHYFTAVQQVKEKWREEEMERQKEMMKNTGK